MVAATLYFRLDAVFFSLTKALRFGSAGFHSAYASRPKSIARRVLPLGRRWTGAATCAASRRELASGADGRILSRSCCALFAEAAAAEQQLMPPGDRAGQELGTDSLAKDLPQFGSQSRIAERFTDERNSGIQSSVVDGGVARIAGSE